MEHRPSNKPASCNVYIAGLPTRLRELADAIEGCEWLLPITASDDCQAAAEEIEAWRGTFPSQETCPAQEN